MKALPADFYDRPVLEVARDLIGCSVEHRAPDAPALRGVIVETEAYHQSEPACHAFVGLTPRTKTLFDRPGLAYVYRSYGVHALLNAVCEPEGVGAAVLIRALMPTQGLEEMRVRRTVVKNGAQREPAGEEDLCSGPGKLTQALGISLGENGTCLASGPVQIGPPAGSWRSPAVVVGRRVGINRAIELPWRFSAAGCRHVSRPRPQARPGES